MKDPEIYENPWRAYSLDGFIAFTVFLFNKSKLYFDSHLVSVSINHHQQRIFFHTDPIPRVLKYCTAAAKCLESFPNFHLISVSRCTVTIPVQSVPVEKKLKPQSYMKTVIKVEVVTYKKKLFFN